MVESVALHVKPVVVAAKFDAPAPETQQTTLVSVAASQSDAEGATTYPRELDAIAAPVSTKTPRETVRILSAPLSVKTPVDATSSQSTAASDATVSAPLAPTTSQEPSKRPSRSIVS